MSKQKAPQNGKRRFFGVMLLVLAALMVLLAFQSVSTDQYKLYNGNYDYYLAEAAECRAQEDSDLGSHYAYLAGEWEATAKLAGEYLTQHRAGAASLGVVSLLSALMGVKLLLPVKRKETKE